MEIEEVDAVGTELREALLDGAYHVETMVASGVRIARIACHGEFCCQDDPLAFVADESSEQPFGTTVGIVHCRVDEIAAAIDVEIEDAACLVTIRTPSPCRTERHRPEAHRRYPQARTSKKFVMIKGHIGYLLTV